MAREQQVPDTCAVTVPPAPIEPSGARLVEGPEFTTYAEFGGQFFAHAVTEERVLRGVATLAGRPIEFGPVGVGPVGLVKASATGRVGEPTLARHVGELVAFELTLPVDLQMVIDFGLEKSRFRAEVAVRLALTARAARPLVIVIDVEPPTRDNVDVKVHADGLRASVLQVVGRVDAEVRRAVAKYVARELRKPQIQQARVIDVAAALAAYSHRT